METTIERLFEVIYNQSRELEDLKEAIYNQNNKIKELKAENNKIEEQSEGITKIYIEKNGEFQQIWPLGRGK